MRDLGQRSKESGLEKQLQSPSSYTPNTDFSQTEDILSKALSLKTRADDVDCELPPGLQSLESKEMLLNKELGTNAELIEDLFKAREPSHPLAVTFTAEMVLGREPSVAKQQKADRARRRKVQRKFPKRLMQSAHGRAFNSIRLSNSCPCSTFSLTRADTSRGARSSESWTSKFE